MILSVLCLFAFDYMPPTLYWTGHYAGYEYYDSRGTMPVHTYPIYHMLDGDPATAWMVGGLNWYSEEKEAFVADKTATLPPKLFFVLPKPIRVDGLRIMPGYNKSAEVFRRNNRITGVSLYSAPEGEQYTYVEKPFQTAMLKDELGWQELKFAPRIVQYFMIEVTDWEKGADNDFCVSEIQFLSAGKPIEWNLTPLMLSTIGSDCGCGTMWHVIDRKGKAVREAGVAEFDPWFSDPSGRYVFSSALTKNYIQFYVLDMVKGAFVARADRPRNGDKLIPSIWEVAWKDGVSEAQIVWESGSGKGKEETIRLKWEP